MKAQLSRDSHRPEERFSGVYQQQGRMLTDADWNELVDTVKRQQRRALGTAAGSGVPRDGGLLDLTDTRTEPGRVDTAVGLRWGRVVVDGIIGDCMPAAGITAPFDYAGQRFFPDPPAPPAGTASYYVDLWERLVVSIQDPNLRDPALHGADTCVRTQVITQVKHCTEESFVDDRTRNPNKGNAEFDLSYEPNGVDQGDTCTSETSIARDLGNYLFRLEIHKVDGTADAPGSILLKWSSENGAEAHRTDSVPNEFKSGDWIYEFFSDTTELHLGVHFDNGTAIRRPTLVDDGYPQAIPEEGVGRPFPYVRRWDGFCVIGDPAGTWSLQENKHRGKPVEVNPSPPAGTLSLLIDDLRMDLLIDGKTFVAGDYWLALLRQHGVGGGVPQVLDRLPVGIVHHYLSLRTNDVAGTLSFTGNEADIRRLSFPPLTGLTAERVEYSPTLTQTRWEDINDRHPELLPRTVQDAVDQLAANVEASDILYQFLDSCDDPVNTGPARYGVKALNDYLKADLGITPPGGSAKIKDLWDRVLCLLDARRIPYDPTVREARWKDIKEIGDLGFVWSGVQAELSGTLNPGKLARDANENVIAAVSSIQMIGAAEHYRSIVIKLDRNGTLVWRKELDALVADVGFLADGTAVAAGTFRQTVDFGGSVGATMAAGQVDVFVAKFDAAGDAIWADHFGTSDQAWCGALAIDSLGAIYLTGQFDTTINFSGTDLTASLTASAIREIFLVKLNADGTHAWSANYGASGEMRQAQVTVDGNDNVLITGSFAGTLNFGGAVLTSPSPTTVSVYFAKFSGTGAHQWSKQFGGAGRAVGTSVAVDGEANILLAGAYTDTIDFGGGPLPIAAVNAAFVAKFSDSGTDAVPIWSNAYPSTSQSFIFDVATDAGNNVVFGGGFSGTINFGGTDITSTGGYDAFIVRTASDGAHLSSRGLDVGQYFEISGSLILHDDGLPVLAWQAIAIGVISSGASVTYVSKLNWERMVAPATVQEAIDDLVQNLESSDIEYRLPACADVAADAALSVGEIFNRMKSWGNRASLKLDDVLDTFLCSLDANAVPYLISGNDTLLDVILNKKTGGAITGDVALTGNLGVSGNVGIGTASPESQLHLSGGGRWNPTTTEGDLKIGSATHRFKIGVAVGGSGAGDVRIRAHGGTNRLMLGGGVKDVLTIKETNVGVNTTDPDVNAQLHVDGNLRVDGRTSLDGTVGIGTATPAAKLEVFKDDPDGTGSFLKLKQGAAGLPTRLILDSTVNNINYQWNLNSNSDGKFHLEYNPVGARLTIDPLGNVGIGTPTPGEKLEVAGTVKATAFAGDGSALTGLGADKWSDGAAGAIYYNGGSVGIGESNPNPFGEAITALRVKGTAATLELDSEQSGKRWRLASAANGRLYFHQFQVGQQGAQKSGVLVLESVSGHVGINQNDPQEALHVTGNLRVDGEFNPGSNVGIGTSTPSYKLDVQGNTSMYVGQFRNANTGTGTTYGISAEGDARGTSASYSGVGASFVGRGGSTGGSGYGSINYAYANGSSTAYAVWASATGGATTGREYAFYGWGDCFFSGDVGIGAAGATGDKLYVDGNCYSSKGWFTRAADYAEYFEAGSKSAIPAGTSVAMQKNGKIRAARDGDVPIGIVTGGSAIVGNSYREWPKKYLRDEFGAPVMEEYKKEIMVPKTEKMKKERQKVERKAVEEEVTRTEVVLVNKKYREKEITEKITHEVEEPVFKEADLFDPKGKEKIGTHRIPVMETYEEEVQVLDDDGMPVLVGSGKFVTEKRPKLNPDYDESKEYTPREKRPEWNCVGLLGQLPLRKGQPVAPGWVRIRDISDEVELWLVK